MATKGLQFLGKKVGQEELGLIREVVAGCRGLSRMELAATVCELMGWTRRSGKMKARECREFLERLEAQGRLVLPEKRQGRPVGATTQIPTSSQGEAGAVLSGTAREVGEIELERVGDESARRLFRELVGRYHYLSHKVPVGAQVRYLVRGSQTGDRVLACVQFSSAAWRLAVRDRWIGWDEATRARRLVHVVSNSRYLLLPWVQVKNLASRILSAALRRMASDWEAAYGVAPWLVETLVDPTRYQGTCYRGANWIELGLTRGGRRQDRLGKPERIVPKKVLVYPLVHEAARRLREEVGP